MCNEKLRTQAILEVKANNGIRATARAWGVTHGMIARALRGGNSPTLRRLWNIPKHPPMPRLIINSCPPALKQRFEQQRGDMSRVDYLTRLLDLEMDY